MKKIIILFLLLLFPINVFAYSNYLITGGKQIGIEIHSKGVYIIDYSQALEKDFLKEDLQKGDRIIKINKKEINNLKDLNEVIKEKGTYDLTIIRNKEELNRKLKAVEEDGQIKTGLFVKDEINGIGTLSYIDPETKIYASLGHEILESSTNTLFEVGNGYVYDVDVNYINKSEDGNIGEFHGNFRNNIIGTLEKNEINGIYGKYMESLPKIELTEVGKAEEIKKGKAEIKMMIEGKEQFFDIDIISIQDVGVKNISFEITSEELLEKTGGVIQGMSGSPIIQNNKIIGVVNYVVVNDSKKGYGIFIEKMLEEGDKLQS